MSAAGPVGIHNGETRRKAVMWDWVVRIGSGITIPVAGAVLILWADVRHLVSDQPTHSESHEALLRFMERGDRFTREDGRVMEDRIKGWVEERYPPKWMQDDLKAIKTIVQENQLTIRELQVTVQDIKKEIGK